MTLLWWQRKGVLGWRLWSRIWSQLWDVGILVRWSLLRNAVVLLVKISEASWPYDWIHSFTENEYIEKQYGGYE